jgi:hypothetical protein
MNTNKLELKEVNVLPAIAASVAEHKQHPDDSGGINLVQWYNIADDDTKLTIDKILMMVCGQGLTTLVRMAEEPNYRYSLSDLNEHQSAAEDRFDRWLKKQYEP